MSRLPGLAAWEAAQKSNCEDNMSIAGAPDNTAMALHERDTGSPDDGVQSASVGPAAGNDGTIQSEVLLTLVQTRAQIVSMMANPALGPLAKQVGCLLWAITETWKPGETKRIPWTEIADAIAWTSTKVLADETVDLVAHPHPRMISAAIKQLECAGYIIVNRVVCTGRGKSAAVSMKRRTVADPYCQKGPGSDFRVWTNAITAEYAAEKGAGDMRAYDGKAVGHMHPSEGKGACDRQASEEKGAGDLHPYKETSSHKGTCPQADLSPADTLPSCGDSAAAEPPAPAWSEVTDAESVLALVKRSLDRRALREWSSSRQREAQQGLQAWMVGSGASAQEALYLVSAWVADRRLANCNFVTEWLTRHAEQAAAIRNLLDQADPTSVIVAGHEDGLEWRRRRLRKAG